MKSRKVLICSMLIFLREIIGCPYESYDDALLPTSFPQDEKKIDLKIAQKNNKLNLISIGYWTFCIPHQIFEIYPKVGQEYNPEMYDSGQFIMLIDDNNEQKIINYINLNYQDQQVQHIFTFLNSEQEDIYFNYDFAFYEGIWLFTLITYNHEEKLINIQLSSNQNQIIQINEFSSIKIILGGRGIIGDYNFNVYRGRISKLQLSYYESDQMIEFDKIITFCQIPKEFSSEQQIILVNGFKRFDSSDSVNIKFKHAGQFFFLSGWVKYDFSKIIKSAYMPLIRISLFQSYNFFSREGDEIFYLEAYVSKDVPSQTNLYYCKDYHNAPIYSMDNFFWYDELLSADDDNLLIEALQQWHFIKMEYVSAQIGFNLLSIEFSNELGNQQRNFFGRQAINSIYYVFLGKDDFSSDQLQADLYNFQLNYNYLDRLKYYYIDRCHYSCLKCDGPFYNNCLQCYEDSNRLNLYEQKICSCKRGFIDVGDKICQEQNSLFTSLFQNETFDNLSENCNFGYFKLPISQDKFDCLQCPQEISKNILCAECIFYPNEWYKNPQCLSDLLFYTNGYEDGTYIKQIRSNIDIDLYFIDEFGQMTLHSQYLGFCNPDNNNENCHLSKYKHLSQDSFIICKPNYFYQNDQCQFLSPFCLEIDFQGNCIKKIEGIYEKDDNQFYQCPLNCLDCNFNIQKKQIECFKCLIGYGLYNNQCIQCGNYCKNCQNYYDLNLQINYLKCYQCVDNSKYFISFDSINCIENTIKNCIYAFQAIKDDFRLNTLDLHFIPRNDTQNIQMYCARCSYNYIYVFSTNQCLQGINSSCDFGYAETTYDIVLDSSSQETLIQNQYIEYNSLYITYGFDEYGQMILTSSQICLIQEQYSISAIEFISECLAYSSNCLTCIQGQKFLDFFFYVCNVCKVGYYSDRITNKCAECPSNLNCLSCFQQQKLSQDNWKSKIRAFYKMFIEKTDSKHPFVLYGQSQDQDDYEIKCEICQKGYRLYKNQCLLTCQESCLECQNYDDVDQCVLCPQEIQGRQLTIQNNSCIQCPQNCALCRARSNQEIYQINCLFNNKQFEIFTYQCLRSFKDKDYYYDNYLGRYIDCETYDKCQKIYIISLNLYCDKKEYYFDLSQITDNNQINNFKKQNILLDNLISKEESFSEFQNDQFYTFANQDSIKTILIKISSKKQQDCIIDIDGVIQQQFSYNIFSSISIEIQIFFEQETIFYIKRSLSFLNFKSIELNNVQFFMQQNNKHKFISFNSVFSQNIILKNINFQQLGNLNDQSQIYFENISKLLIDNIQLKNLIQNSVDYFLKVQQSQQNQKDISIQNLNIQNSIFSNQILIFYEQNSQDVINFNNWTLNFVTQNFSILSYNSIITSGNIYIENIQLNVIAEDTIIFVVDRYANVKVKNISLYKSNFINSSLFILNELSIIHQVSILQSSFIQQSVIIFNSNKMINLLSKLDYQFQNFLFQDNSYDENSKFISIKKFTSYNSKLIGETFFISGNKIINFSKSFNPKSMQSALLYIEQNIIELSNIQINRGQGLVEISIFDSNFINFFYFHITQSQRYKNLQQSLECVNQQSQQIKQPSLTIYGSQNVLLHNFMIDSTQVFNNPIIYYQSADVVDKSQIENLTFINMQISNNIVIQTESNVNYALIYIISSQITNINFTNIIFQNNILNVYQQDYQSPSALLLYINAYKGNLIINNSLISQNVAFNTSNSIIYLKLQQIQIYSSKFLDNNLFIYQNIFMHFSWEYQKQNIYLEDLFDVFKIKSKSGNGIFISCFILMIDTTFKNSKGNYGGAFSIYPQLNSKIELFNLEISHTSTLFTEENEAGGGIFIDGTQCQSIDLQLTNIKANNITSRFNGGLLYFQSGINNVIITLTNAVLSNNYAQIGSLFFILFSDIENKQQDITLKNVTITNSDQEFISYFQKFNNLELSLNETQILMNNRTLIYIQNGNELLFQDFNVNSVLKEGIIVIEKPKLLKIVNLYLDNCKVNSFIIKFEPYQISRNFILLKNILIQNLILGYKLNNQQCEVIIQNPRRKIQFYCSTQNAPEQLFSQNYKHNSFDCYIFKIQDQQEMYNSSLIQIIGLNDLSQLKFDSIILQNINCSLCEQGLIKILYQSQTIQQNYQKIKNLRIKNSNCGKQGCLLITKYFQSFNKLKSSQQNLLEQKQEFQIIDFLCLNNTSINGSCLYIENIKILIASCILNNNKAEQNGGSIFVKGTKDFIFKQCLVENNSAKVGGGIVFQDQQIVNYKLLNNLIIQNQAQLSNQDILSLPSTLSVQFGKMNNILQNQIEIENSNEKIDVMKGILYFPSGQKLSEYQIFNLHSKSFTSYQKQFRILAMDYRGSQNKNLTNSQCLIQSRIYNSSNLINTDIFSNNYTNINFITFNQDTNDYNLDDIIIYHDNNLANDIYLQLQFICNQVSIPKFSKQYPFNIISSHSNYKLRVNIRSFPCQYGEIKNRTDNSCIQCDGKSDFFSLTLNAEKCEIKDDISTIQVTSVKLNLRPNFWRPYFDSNQISYCINQPSNCLGGWIEGDSSCITGNIGAICESCDIYNIRGEGHFSVQEKYLCAPCTNKLVNLVIIILVCLWIFVSTLISVNTTNFLIQEKLKCYHIQGKNYVETKISTNLLKLFTNYLQIIGTLSYLQLKLPIQISLAINSLSSPTKQTVYSIDCFLINFMQIEVHYGRVIWQVVTFILYINGFLIFYFILIFINLIKLNFSVIYTAIIYIYIYIQPSLIGGFIELISSLNISGYKWIQANLAFRYDTIIHFQWMIKFCLPMIILLALIIPLILFLCLYMNKQNLQSKNIMFKWGYLYLEYKNKSYFWEIIKIIQKELIILFLMYYDDDVITKASLIQIILIIYLELNSIYKPYYISYLNQIDSLSTHICLISLALSIGIYVSKQNNFLEIQIPFIIILISINLYLVIIFVINLIVEYFKEKFSFLIEKSDIIRDYIRKKFPFLMKIDIFARLLENKKDKKQRIDQLFKKLKLYLRTVAREKLKIKKSYQGKFISQQQQNFELNQNLRSIPLSIRSQLSQENISLIQLKQDKQDSIQNRIKLEKNFTLGQ